MTKQLTRQEVEAVVGKFSGESPIYIGTLIDRIHYTKYVDLLNRWNTVGFSKSLQEVISESGWKRVSLYAPLLSATFEGESVTEVPSISIQDVEVLTSPEANALFSFLQEIL